LEGIVISDSKGGDQMKSLILSLSLFVFILFSTFLPYGNLYSYWIGTDFEEPIPDYELDRWGRRNVDYCQWGPQVQTTPGGMWCVGVPESCTASYIHNLSAFFTTPEIALDDSFPSLYLRFNYWADLEQIFRCDGVIIEFINLTKGTTSQIDSLAQGELIPTYDGVIGGICSGSPLQGLYAYNRDRIPWTAVESVDLIALGYADPGDTIQIRWQFASDSSLLGAGYFIDDLYLMSSPPGQ
jgi:hypothetical protein